MQSVMKLLQLSANTSREAQAQVVQGQEQLQRHPEWMTHLCAVLIANNSQCDRYHRQLAGIMLKNFVKRQYGTTTAEAREALKQMILRALGDEHVPVRRTAGTVILSVVEKEEGFDKWNGLLQSLVQALDAAAPPALQDGALYCVALLCEDATRELEDCAQRPLNALVPILVRLLGGAAGEVPRLRALRALNAFVVDWPNAMKINSQAFLDAVFVCANSSDAEVCREVCRTFSTLCDVKGKWNCLRLFCSHSSLLCSAKFLFSLSFSHSLPPPCQPDLIGRYIQSVASFMLAQSGKRSEPELQCEAMEFWQVLAEQVMWHEALRAKVQQLLPLLLDGILYDAEDVEALMELDDASVPLAERHIAPWFAKGRRAKGRDEEGADDKVLVVVCCVSILTFLLRLRLIRRWRGVCASRRRRRWTQCARPFRTRSWRC